MRRAARVDGNQAEIVQALRRVGASVQLLHQLGQGCPDLLVGFRERNYLLEVKRPGEKLTDDERRWFHLWRGCCEVVHSVEEALSAIEAVYVERMEAEEPDHDRSSDPEVPRTLAV